jgi:photosystem II stability/assembly factor-like uncharacterized protein
VTRPRHAPGRRRARTAFLLAPLLALAACSEAPDAEPGQPLDVTHVHGLAVDPEDPQRVFVATHEGLGAWTEDGVERVSGSTADFLDLAADPASARFLGTTGRGWLVASEDGGRTFEPVPGAPRLLLVNFLDDGTVLGVAADGSLQTGLADGSWEAAGANAGEGLQAMTVGPDGTVWVLDGEGLRRSTDRGRTLESVPGW